MIYNNPALPASLVARFVELADQRHWDESIAARMAPVEIVTMVLTHVDAPMTVDDYEAFIGSIRILPESVWSGPGDYHRFVS